ESALLQVLDEAIARLIDITTLIRQTAGDVCMRIPVVVINLHEANAALNEPAREQSRVGESARLFHRVAVEVESVLGFVGEVCQLGNARLHAKREFVLLDARPRFRIADLLVGQLVESAKAIERFAADRSRNARRIVDVKN